MSSETLNSFLKADSKYRNIYRFVALALVVFVFIDAQRTGDFWFFLEASKLLHNGGDIYSATFYDGFHYFYSVLFALILIPFTYLPSYLVILMWLILDLFFLVRIWKIVKGYLDLNSISEKQYLWLMIFGWGFSSRFLFNNFHTIQMTIFLLYALLQGITWILIDKKFAGSILIGLAINIKILPVVAIPYLLYRNQLRSVIYIVFFTALFYFIPSLFIGLDRNWFLMKEWWTLANPNNPIHMIDIDETGFHGLPSWIPTLLMENTSNNFTLPLKRNILNLDVSTVSMIINITRLAFVSFMLYFLRTFPFKPSPSKPHTFWELSYLALLIPLIFPHQHLYSFFCIFPAGVYIVYFLMSQQENSAKYKSYLWLFMLSFLLLSIGGIIGTIDKWTQHYKLITYGTLLLLIPLAKLRPELLKPRTN